MALLGPVLAAGAAVAQAQEPYRFYGGDIDRQEKSPAVEACEYEELVEKQRCNAALNKSTCIENVREECALRFPAEADDDQEPDTPQP